MSKNKINDVDMTRVSLFVWHEYDKIDPPEDGNYLCWVYVYHEDFPGGYVATNGVYKYTGDTFAIKSKLPFKVIYWAEVPHPEQG